MRDFTLTTFQLLLHELKSQGYTFQTFRDFLKNPAPQAIVLRHDVDARKLNSLQTARLEAELEITGTYYFRMVPQSFDPGVIHQIAALGHEIGYHYEDLALAKGNRETAIQLFEQHLAKLRQVVTIETICMHGSPLSRYDNRTIWENFNYRNYNIIGEPYFDVNFSKVLYLTDTGRRWDGEKVSVRDKVGTSLPAGMTIEAEDGRQEARNQGVKERVVKGQGQDLKKPSFHSTFDIIKATKAGLLPAQLMINVHPQRWDDRVLPWIKELIWQRVKNRVKGVILNLTQY